MIMKDGQVLVAVSALVPQHKQFVRLVAVYTAPNGIAPHTLRGGRRATTSKEVDAAFVDSWDDDTLIDLAMHFAGVDLGSLDQCHEGRQITTVYREEAPAVKQPQETVRVLCIPPELCDDYHSTVLEAHTLNRPASRCAMTDMLHAWAVEASPGDTITLSVKDMSQQEIDALPEV